jgi:hypothetical protein
LNLGFRDCSAFLLWNEKKVVPLFHDAMYDVLRPVSTFRAVASDATEYSRKRILIYYAISILDETKEMAQSNEKYQDNNYDFFNTPRICYMVKGMIGNH